MITEILFFLTNIGLILYLFYRERQHERTVRSILTARLSRDMTEFKGAVEEPKPERPVKPEPVEIPLEDVSPKEMLGAFKKSGQEE